MNSYVVLCLTMVVFVVFEGFCCGTTSQDSVQPSNVVITRSMLRSQRSVASRPCALRGEGEGSFWREERGRGDTVNTARYIISPLSSMDEGSLK